MFFFLLGKWAVFGFLKRGWVFCLGFIVCEPTNIYVCFLQYYGGGGVFVVTRRGGTKKYI